MVGCSSPEAAEGPWADEFEQAIRDAQTQFEKDILADGRITDAEFSEATAKYLDCMESAGVPVEIVGSGAAMTFQTTDNAGFDAHDPTCQTGTIQLLSPLYVGINQNPNNDDIMQLVADCLVEAGVAPKSYDASALEREISENSGVPVANPEVLSACANDPGGRGE